MDVEKDKSGKASIFCWSREGWLFLFDHIRNKIVISRPSYGASQ